MTGNPEVLPETILLVEHCETVSESVISTLKEAKFSVLHAQSGSNAVELSSTHKGAIHLLLADVNMPEMLASEIAEAVKMTHPNVRVIFISGMGNGGILMLNEGWAFFNDPFVPESLLQLISVALRASDQAESDRHPKRTALNLINKRTVSKRPKLLTMTANSSIQR